MESRFLILTIFVCLATLLSGCASLLSGFNGPGDDLDSWDSTPTSQAAPEEHEPLDVTSEEYHHNQVARAVQNRDIVMGMSAREVVSAWGRPRDVEVAGDGGGGNERWVYYSGNSRRYDLGGAKTIYFENGRVVGWESR